MPGVALRKNKVPNVESSLSKPVSWRYFTEKLHDKDRQGRLPVYQRKRTRLKKCRQSAVRVADLPLLMPARSRRSGGMRPSVEWP
jgi:hypothetical protein